MPEEPTEKSIDSVLSIIMGGGQGSRLFPLTHNRSKPAVPLAGKYRIVDIPISNCINSGLRKMYVLTQFNSESLNRHITSGYKFDHFGDNFVHVLAAQQTPGDDNWYQGTADAVRQNLSYFLEKPYKYFLILSGDQLYRMDFRKMLKQHRKTGADVTIATTPVPREPARAFGLMHTDGSNRITRFVEKPGKNDAALDELVMPPELLESVNLPIQEERFQASMGIYIFNRKVLEDALDNDSQDFGKHIIPAIIKKKNVFSYIFMATGKTSERYNHFMRQTSNVQKSSLSSIFSTRRIPSTPGRDSFPRAKSTMPSSKKPCSLTAASSRAQRFGDPSLVSGP